ncbi:MAG: CotH kinase family protein [Bacteroidota bacterium]|nr:CotH kinase family protein [Bacteroidota bacterium]
MVFLRRIALLFLLIISFSSFSQNHFYNVDTIREIKLYFQQADWDYILDSLYIEGNNDRLLADIIIDGNHYDSVGVRYKGFSSVSVNYIKNPFNIKLDYVIEGQDHQGIDKLKLSNVIQDPSFVREVLSYEIARKYIPASEGNYANLYINDTLWGLYTNIEAVNKKFLSKHYGSKYNPFFKCNPDHLDIQIGGENSNLSNTHGTDSSDYYDYYSLKSDYGWKDLYDLIDTLNNHSDSIANSLNVDRTLWLHAFNYSLINFDSYIGYSQNYYLYKDQTKKFNPIIWDLNMSFGGFRLTDASQLYFNGFDILQAQNMDPFVHHNYMSVSPRPLMRNLFSNERYRKMYMAHIRTIIEENFVNQDYFMRAQHLQNLIDLSVQNDTNKFYSYIDFTTNLTNQVSLPASICPGITQLMDARTTYLSGYSGYSGEPQINNIVYNPQNFLLGSDIWITADVTDATYVMLSYRFGKNQSFKKVQMYDDGNHNDGIAGDNKYGGKISKSSNVIQYYLYADNDSAGVFSPERAAHEYYSIESNLQAGDLVINELMSNNVNIVSDPSGAYEDWIELYNTTSYPISTHSLYLTDTITKLLKWQMPNYVIPSDSYLIIWADEDQGQGVDHSNFKLSNFGETLILVDKDSAIIDSVSYLSQQVDVAFARSPNGIGPFTMLTPTFNKSNNLTFIEESTKPIVVFPNPFSERLYIEGNNITITDVVGRTVYHSKKYNRSPINTSKWNSGIYFVNLNNTSSTKLIKIK